MEGITFLGGFYFVLAIVCAFLSGGVARYVYITTRSKMCGAFSFLFVIYVINILFHIAFGKG